MTIVRVGSGLTATRLHVEQVGPPPDQAEPLLWITGFAISSEIFAPVVGAYAGRFSCIRYDNRGSGRSQAPWRLTSIPELAGDAVRLLDALGVDSAHVYGLSMGGMVAQEMAIRFPDRVRALVLGGTSHGGPRSVPPSPQVAAALATRGAPVQLRAELVSRALFTDDFRRRHPARVSSSLADLAAHRATARGLVSHTLAASYHDTRSRLHLIQAPTLVVHGQQDRLTPVGNALPPGRAHPRRDPRRPAGRRARLPARAAGGVAPAARRLARRPLAGRRGPPAARARRGGRAAHPRPRPAGRRAAHRRVAGQLRHPRPPPHRPPTGDLVDADEVRRQLTTPLGAPAYPPGGPYRFTGREYLNIWYRTDLEAVRRVVPEPLTVTDPVVKFEVMRMPDVTGLGSFTESGQVLRVEHEGEPADYLHAMYVDSLASIASGREISAFPKKFGKPALYLDGDTLVGTLDYRTLRVATATMGFKHGSSWTRTPATRSAPDVRAQDPARLRPAGRGSASSSAARSPGWTSRAPGRARPGCSCSPTRSRRWPTCRSGRSSRASHILCDLTLGRPAVVHDYLEEAGREVLYEVDGRVATITLNRPDQRNAVSPELATQLGEAVATFEADPEVWVAVLTGAGPELLRGRRPQGDPRRGPGRRAVGRAGRLRGLRPLPAAASR